MDSWIKTLDPEWYDLDSALTLPWPIDVSPLGDMALDLTIEAPDGQSRHILCRDLAEAWQSPAVVVDSPWKNGWGYEEHAIAVAPLGEVLSRTVAAYFTDDYSGFEYDSLGKFIAGCEDLSDDGRAALQALVDRFGEPEIERPGRIVP